MGHRRGEREGRMKLLEACCKASGFHLSIQLLRGARPVELAEELVDLVTVHQDLVTVGGVTWKA